MTSPVQIGLPDQLARRILRMLGEDSKFDLAAIMRGTEATPEQIAAHAAASSSSRAGEGAWSWRPGTVP